MKTKKQLLNPKKSVHTPHGESQRQTIIETAFQQIANGGFENLRTREVAAQVGINNATLHYYFPTKEDLIIAVAEYVHHHFSQPIKIQSQRSPLDELRTDFLEMRQRLKEKPEVYLLLTELFLRSFRVPSLRKLMQDMDKRWQSQIESYLNRGKQLFQFRQDLDVHAAASALLALFQGSALQALTNPEDFPIELIQHEIEKWLIE
jgi:Uncharacterized protein conserved in bacteria